MSDFVCRLPDLSNPGLAKTHKGIMLWPELLKCLHSKMIEQVQLKEKTEKAAIEAIQTQPGVE